MCVKRGILEKLFTFVGLVSSFNFKLGKKKKKWREKVELTEWLTLSQTESFSVLQRPTTCSSW